MDKKLLSKLKRPVLPENFHNRTEAHTIVTAEIKIINHKKILVINFFSDKDFNSDIKYIRLSNYMPCFRIFIEKNDYITQDLRIEKTKWYEGCLSNIVNFFGNYGDINSKDMYVCAASLKKAESYFKNKTNCLNIDTAMELYCEILKFQNDIMQKRLMLKYKNTFDKINYHMKQIKLLPQKFNEWVCETALFYSRYIIYDYECGKRYFNAYCTHCGNDLILDTKETYVRNNHRGICPICKSQITFKAHKKFSEKHIDSVWCSILQKTKDNNIVLRSFKVYKIYQNKGEKGNYRVYMSELCRTFFYKDKVYSYEYYYVYHLRFEGWYFDIGCRNCGRSALYEKNIKAVIKDTDYKYSALDKIAKNLQGSEFSYWNYIYYYKSNFYFEYLVKLNLYNLLESLPIYNNNFFIDKNKKRICDILMINKENLKILKKLNGDCDMLKLLQKSQESDICLSAEQANKVNILYKSGVELLKVCGYISVDKAIEFIEREYKVAVVTEKYSAYRNKRRYTKEEQKNKKMKNLFDDWLEYLNWCKELGYNMKNKKIVVPVDFYVAHDRVSEAYGNYISIKNKSKRKRLHFMFLDVIEKYKDYSFNDNGLTLIVPNSEGAFKKESKMLCHCVKNYVSRVAESSTMIFFIRKSNDIKTPFYTLEYRNGKIIQCRGYKNCETTGEIDTFLSKFLIRAKEIEKNQSKQ